MITRHRPQRASPRNCPRSWRSTKIDTKSCTGALDHRPNSARTLASTLSRDSRNRSASFRAQTSHFEVMPELRLAPASSATPPPRDQRTSRRDGTGPRRSCASAAEAAAHVVQHLASPGPWRAFTPRTEDERRMPDPGAHSAASMKGWGSSSGRGRDAVGCRRTCVVGVRARARLRRAWGGAGCVPRWCAGSRQCPGCIGWLGGQARLPRHLFALIGRMMRSGPRSGWAHSVRRPAPGGGVMPIVELAT